MADIEVQAIEAKCTRYAKLAGGRVTLGFEIHMDDVCRVLGIEPGRRYRLGFAEIGDDEKPIPVMSRGPQQPTVHTRLPVPARLSYPQRAGILSKDPLFRMWLSETNQKIDGVLCSPSDFAAQRIREYCGVKSRADIKSNTESGTRLDLLESAFVAWRDGPKHGV